MERNSIILAVPIFQDLAIALMAGEIASLIISGMIEQVLYDIADKHSRPESIHSRS